MVKKNNNNDGINQENEDKLEKQKEKLNEEIKALEEALEKQEARLSGLQSNAFQLANYYFVFQGCLRFLCIHREVPKKKETEMQRLH
ncbi:uncharacterized protein LOC123914913 isoform X5 [Trifolium pratense]|uniref:uncharacterized protein LOC123914913 isoform X5 n=1 Tax=Trifolium pratense TaxID=57577 RepID=UPI001E690812|nr:uncharacterized protein LOC123914913 isoform X5 [Trifolium pratense]